MCAEPRRPPQMAASAAAAAHGDSRRPQVGREVHLLHPGHAMCRPGKQTIKSAYAPKCWVRQQT